jgi:hypothetical protein
MTDDRLPGIQAAPINDQSHAIMLCAFRLCDCTPRTCAS